MDLIILTGAQLRLQPALSESIRLRHKIFVEKLSWEALRHPSGLERDAFDTDTAVHFLVLSSTGSIAAYSRLLPTTQPHLLSDVYPELLDGKQVPIGNEIWEWTRTTAVPVPTTPANSHDDVGGLGFAIKSPGRMLYFAIVQWAITQGIKTLSLQCDQSFAVVIEALGAKAEVLARPSKTEEGMDVVPMLMHLRDSTLGKMKECFGWVDGVGVIGQP